METAQITIILVAASVFLSAFYEGGGVGAQSLAPAPSTDCVTSLLNVSDCLTFVETGSKLKVPEEPCCGELAGLVESNPICLCELLGNSNSFGVQIDHDKALKLPSVCHVDTPPVSTCSRVPPGTAGAPSSGNKDNGVSSIAVSSLAFFVGLAIAFISSFFLF